MSKVWTKERLNEALNLLSQGKTTAEVANLINKKYGTNVSHDAVRIKVNRVGYKTNGEPIEEQSEKHSEVTKVSKGITAKIDKNFREKREFTDEELLRIAGIANPEDYHITKVRGGQWSVVTTKKGRMWNYSTNVTAEHNPIDYKSLVKSIEAHVKPFELSKEEPSTENTYDYLVVPIFDTHFNGETLPYYEHALQMQKKVLFSHRFKKIIMIQGGDAVHVDTVNSTTTKGTLLETTKINKMIDEALKYFETLIGWCLKQADELKFISVPGNHDYTTSYMLVRILQKEYAKADIDWDIDLYEHYKADSLGHNMIGVTHGDKGKRNYVSIYASKFPQIWATATNRELYTGHLHTELDKDLGGIFQRQISTLKPNELDQWSKDIGAISRKTFELVEYSEEMVSAVHYIY